MVDVGRVTRQGNHRLWDREGCRVAVFVLVLAALAVHIVHVIRLVIASLGWRVTPVLFSSAGVGEPTLHQLGPVNRFVLVQLCLKPLVRRHAEPAELD
jgi:hypothetical protein